MADPRPANPDPVTSVTLLDRLRANEPEAWRATVELYSGLVYGWCHRAGVAGADADDLAQEVFLQAANKLALFRRDKPGDTFRGWLRAVTRNLALMHFRKAGRTPDAPGGTDAQRKLHDIADPAARDDDPAEGDGERAWLMTRAIELVRPEFEPKTWDMFWRVAVDGRPPADVAAEFAVSSAAVRKAKSRVLFRLKDRFAELLD